jgi:hypothetical protein
VVDAGGDVTIDTSGAVTASGAIAADGAVRIGQAGSEVASLVADVLDGGTAVSVDASGDITTWSRAATSRPARLSVGTLPTTAWITPRVWALSM